MWGAMRILRYALLGLLALGALVTGEAQSALASHVADFWVHEVNDGVTKTVPGASFWGFVSSDSSEDFLGPFDQDRQGQLDPVNVIFFTSDSSPALDVAASALKNSGWTETNPCPIAADIFAYFEGAATGAQQGLHLFWGGA